MTFSAYPSAAVFLKFVCSRFSPFLFITSSLLLKRKTNITMASQQQQQRQQQIVEILAEQNPDLILVKKNITHDDYDDDDDDDDGDTTTTTESFKALFLRRKNMFTEVRFVCKNASKCMLFQAFLLQKLEKAISSKLVSDFQFELKVIIAKAKRRISSHFV